MQITEHETYIEIRSDSRFSARRGTRQGSPCLG